MLQQAAENVVNCLVREALSDDHSRSRIGVESRLTGQPRAGNRPPRLRKDLSIAPPPGLFPESPCGSSILLCRAENEGMLETPHTRQWLVARRPALLRLLDTP